MFIQERIPIIIGALIALVCQMILAPNVHIGDAVPNFMLAYIIAISVANMRGTNYVIAFIVGLLFDLSGTGPVGAMAFVCVAVMFACSQIVRALDSEGPLAAILVIIVACLASEAAYGLLMIACGVDVTLLDALVYRMLPCGLYDIVIAIIAYLLVLRFVFRERRTSEMKIIDTSVD